MMQVLVLSDDRNSDEDNDDNDDNDGYETNGDYTDGNLIEALVDSADSILGM